MTRWSMVVSCAVFVASLQPAIVRGQSPPQSPAEPKASAVADAISGLPGFWEQERCQVQDAGGRRTSSRSVFAIFDREWGIAFTQYTDAGCQERAMTAVLRGSYEPTAHSSRVAGAVDIIFRFARKSLVAYDPALLERLNSGVCGNRRWEQGVEQDITSSGCLSIESLAACPQEYDLAKVEGKRLYLGERPRPGINICAESRRPQQLRAAPLQRR